LYDLFDGLSQDDAGTTHFSLAEVVAPCFEVVVLDLSILKGELPSCSLAGEVVAVGMFASSPIGTGVRHLIGEISVVAGHVAPPGGSGRAKVVGCFAMGGDVIEPGAIRTAAVFFVLILCQGIVLCVLAIPRDGTSCPTPQVQSPVFVVGVLLSAVGSVSPCQFPSLAILIHQLQKVFPGICSYETLLYRFGVPDVRQLVHPELGSPLLSVGLEGLYFL
jgi:hypothetical protein